MAKRKAAIAATAAISGADPKGKRSDAALRGDEALASERQHQAIRRRTAAIQAKLDQLKPVQKVASVAAADLRCRISPFVHMLRAKESER